MLKQFIINFGTTYCRSKSFFTFRSIATFDEIVIVVDVDPTAHTSSRLFSTLFIKLYAKNTMQNTENLKLNNYICH